MPSLSSINFNGIFVPGNVFVINDSQANTATTPSAALLIAQMLSTGTATPNVPLEINGYDDAVTAFGKGSIAAIMVNTFRNGNPGNQVMNLVVLPVSDAGGSTAGTGTITITGTATAAGAIYLYIDNNLLTVGVSIGDTPTIIASNIVIAVGAAPLVPVSATATAGVVTLTCLNKGLEASDLVVALNTAGAINGQTLPAGINVAITWTPGAVDPDLASALSNLGTTPYDFIGLGAGKTQSALEEVESTLNDTNGRWSYIESLFGGAWTTYRGTFSGLIAIAETNNNQHLTTFGVTTDQQRSTYNVTAAALSQAAASLSANPSIPVQNIPVDIGTPSSETAFTYTENNTLLQYGMSTFKFDSAGNPYFQRTLTTLTEENGVPSNAYQNVNVTYQLAYVIRAFNSAFDTAFPNYGLVESGTPIPAGQQITTPQLVAGVAIATYNLLAQQGIVQNPENFADTITYAGADGVTPKGVVKLDMQIQLAGQLNNIGAEYSFSTP